MSTKKSVVFPIKVSQGDFRQYINPMLSKAWRGPKGNISRYKIFNYILYVLHTGIQWKQLKPYKNEICWSNIYKWHNRWSKDGSYACLLQSSVRNLDRLGKLDLSVLHGDGSNTVAKKGAKESDTRDISIRRERKSSEL